MATYVSGAIAELGPFELITDGSELPVFAFKLKDEVDGHSAFDVSGGCARVLGRCQRTRSLRTGKTCGG